LRTQIDKLTTTLKQRDEEVRGLKAEVRVARRAEKAHAQTLAERAEQANQQNGMVASSSSSAGGTNGAGSGGNGSGNENGHDPVAMAALVEEKLQLQDLVFDLEVKLEEANDKVATMKREATAQGESHQRALQAARQENGSGVENGDRNNNNASSVSTTSGGSGEGGAADEASKMPLGFRGSFLADKAAQVQGSYVIHLCVCLSHIRNSLVQYFTRTLALYKYISCSDTRRRSETSVGGSRGPRRKQQWSRGKQQEHRPPHARSPRRAQDAVSSTVETGPHDHQGAGVGGDVSRTQRVRHPHLEEVHRRQGLHYRLQRIPRRAEGRAQGDCGVGPGQSSRRECIRRRDREQRGLDGHFGGAESTPAGPPAKDPLVECFAGHDRGL